MNNQLNERQPYTRPTLTIISFRNERGYAGSGEGVFGTIQHELDDFAQMIFGDDSQSGGVSTYEQHNEWGNDGWF